MLQIINLVIDIILSLPSLYRLLKRVYLFIKSEYQSSKFKAMRRRRMMHRRVRLNSRKTARRLFGKRGGSRL